MRRHVSPSPAPFWAVALVLLAVAARGAGGPRTEVLAACSVEERNAMAGDRCCERTTTETGGDGGAGSRYAYVTLLGGVGNSYKYKGYLYNIAIMAKVLREQGSTADFVAIMMMQPEDAQQELAGADKPKCATPPSYRSAPGSGNPPLAALPPEDEAILRRHGVQIRYAQPLWGDKLDFSSMVFAKSLVFQMTEYAAVQFLDADIMPRRNMDAFFGLPAFTICAGMVSPLNAGWMRLTPSCEDYKRLRDHIVEANDWGRGGLTAPSKVWNTTQGWGDPGDPAITWKVLSGVEKPHWTFHHANSEQGLYFHYFGFEKREMDQILFKEVLSHRPTGVASRLLDQPRRVPYPAELGENGGFPCLGAGPAGSYVHFTGKKKPWADPTSEGVYQRAWWQHFDELGTGLERSQIDRWCFKSPLGFFSPASKD